jgi:cytoskeletal protein CcmA (bactofilin family)
VASKDSSSTTSELNFIGRGTIIDGNIKTESSIRVDGAIKGKLICKNTVTVGDGGRIEGDVQAVNAIIGGKIKGKIIVSEKLVLESKSSLVGELKAKKLIIDEGSVFEGTSDMGVSQQPAQVKTMPASSEGTAQ